MFRSAAPYHDRQLNPSGGASEENGDRGEADEVTVIDKPTEELKEGAGTGEQEVTVIDKPPEDSNENGDDGEKDEAAVIPNPSKGSSVVPPSGHFKSHRYYPYTLPQLSRILSTLHYLWHIVVEILRSLGTVTSTEIEEKSPFTLRIFFCRDFFPRSASNSWKRQPKQTSNVIQDVCCVEFSYF